MRMSVLAAARRAAGQGRNWRLCCSLILAGALAGCGGGGNGTAKPRAVAAPFLGAVVSPEPLAGQVAREILAEGGNAADAATALGFALAVSLPSRAGLGGGGACLAYDPSPKAPGGGRPEAILFLPAAPKGGAGGDRPAAVPMLARGLYLLHARYGRLPIQQLVGVAQKMARLGIHVSPELAADIAAVAGPLLADPAARAVFASPTGAPLTAGEGLFQPDLADTLSQLRLNGLLDFYQGALARRLAQAALEAGGGLTAADLAASVPSFAQPIEVRAGFNRVSFLPAPADGGLAAAAAFTELRQNPADLAQAAARALAVAARWRAGGVSGAAVLAEKNLPPATLPPLPASTAFATLDSSGDAVACAVTMNNLFGTGRIAPGTGILLAAAPTARPAPLLSAAIAWNNNVHAFRAAVAGSGQNEAAMATALGMEGALRSKQLEPMQVQSPGAAGVISCGRFLPGNAATCRAETIPAGNGSAFSGALGTPAGGS